MITNAQDMLRALKRGEYAGIILYRGPSQIDGEPIVVIANRITSNSKNVKTGAMVQTFILRSDMSPLDAIRSGDDASICGDCYHRGNASRKRTCYVNVARSVMAVWGAYTRGRYARPGIDYDELIVSDLFAGLFVRLGTYGDPAAAPVDVWQDMVAQASGHNGYTHQWAKPAFAAFRSLCMASVDTDIEARSAVVTGWRYFRVKTEASLIMRDIESVCPASKEAGARVSCLDCKACGGLTSHASRSKVINAHGATARAFNA